jgi:mannosyl-oligosaccharide glucosidase
VWLNVNYLALSELYRLSHEASRGSEASQERVTTLYRQLRLNVLRTVGRSLQRTGYMYESYDDRDGSGRGTRPFAGWTSLVALIASEKYHTEVR